MTSSRLWQPGQLKPMLAMRTPHPFDSDLHLFEIKWDGFRCLAFVGNQRKPSLFLQSRNGRNLTPLFPELQVMSHKIGRQAILDGELVLFKDHRPNFHALQRRSQIKTAAAIANAASEQPVTYVAFDIIHLDGQDLDQQPCEQRRQILADIICHDEPAVMISPALMGSGTTLFHQAVLQGHEGIIAKLRQSPYRPGRRSRDWLKVVHRRSIQCVIGGVTPGRHYGMGSLLVGAYDNEGDGRLIYLGQVGTGFDRTSVQQLSRVLQGTTVPPFADVPPVPPGTIWVVPTAVCDVSYLDLTAERRLRQPVYRGLRSDLDPDQCIVPWSVQEAKGEDARVGD